MGMRTVLGMNRRNTIVDRVNSGLSQSRTDNKYLTKIRMEEVGVPVAETLAFLRDRLDVRRFDLASLPDAWVVKPNMGSQGMGVMLATARMGSTTWQGTGGRVIDERLLRRHMQITNGGEFSAGTMHSDAVMFESLLRPDPGLRAVSGDGLPDIRVLCWLNRPVQAMMRVPTSMSDGKANLHQGGIGVGIDIDAGVTTRAQISRRPITHHPDLGTALIGVPIPSWKNILTIATRASEALNLGYTGLDITIDADRGPVLIEANAHPGLEIQNVNGTGLLGSRYCEHRTFLQATRAHHRAIDL